LSLSIFELVYQHRSIDSFGINGAVYNVMILNLPEDKLMRTHLTSTKPVSVAPTSAALNWHV
jgi:hypothetical protein